MRVEPGQRAEMTVPVTDAMVRAFAELSGDRNPLHLDEEFAKGTVFGRRIAHGMVSAALVSSAIANRLPGTGSVYLGQTLKFLSPVYVGETAVIELEVLSVRPDKPVATIATRVYAGPDRRPAVDGEAVVKFTT